MTATRIHRSGVRNPALTLIRGLGPLLPGAGTRSVHADGITYTTVAVADSSGSNGDVPRGRSGLVAPDTGGKQWFRRYPFDEPISASDPATVL